MQIASALGVILLIFFADTKRGAIMCSYHKIGPFCVGIQLRKILGSLDLRYIVALLWHICNSKAYEKSNSCLHDMLTRFSIICVMSHLELLSEIPLSLLLSFSEKQREKSAPGHPKCRLCRAFS